MLYVTDLKCLVSDVSSAGREEEIQLETESSVVKIKCGQNDENFNSDQ